MATFVQTHSQSSIMDRFNSLIAELKAAHARRRLYRTTLNELRNLTARDLSDLGLHPSMLRQVAYEAAYGK